jgi:hypothetical protein
MPAGVWIAVDSLHGLLLPLSIITLQLHEAVILTHLILLLLREHVLLRWDIASRKQVTIVTYPQEQFLSRLLRFL